MSHWWKWTKMRKARESIFLGTVDECPEYFLSWTQSWKEEEIDLDLEWKHFGWLWSRSGLTNTRLKDCSSTEAFKSRGWKKKKLCGRIFVDFLIIDWKFFESAKSHFPRIKLQMIWSIVLWISSFEFIQHSLSSSSILRWASTRYYGWSAFLH